MMYTDAAARSRSTPRSDEIHIAEEVKIAIDLCLERFRFSDQREMDFPSSFTGTERAYIHRLAQSLGYVSKSKGKGLNRFLTIWKRDGPDRALRLHLPVTQNSLCFIHNLLQVFPVRNKERKDMQPSTKRESSGEKFRPSGFLNNSVPLVPDKRNPSELDRFRRSLPVHECQAEIVRLIRANRVVLVVGETGSGKTTQIPQFLLDDCSMKGEACRIICTQPRRLAVIALAERVAAERGEGVGQTVGYHIRLENRFSSKTVLTFCTAGVLLRTLMAGDTSLTTVTHVIVDEVHERDGLTDFLLIKMQLLLQTIPSLKVILSSAAMDVDLFCQYFGSCPVIHLKGRQFEVKELFLEDVLRLTGFSRKTTRKHSDTQEKRQPCWTEKCQAVGNSGGDEKRRSPGSLAGGDAATIKPEERDSEQLEPWLVKEMDSCIASIFYHGDQDALDQLFNLILCENVTVDYTHSETGATPLMVTASRGLLAPMEQLLIMGADMSVQAFNGWRASDFARSFQQTDAVDLLQSSIPLRETSGLEELTLDQCGSAGPSTEERELLQLYHDSFDDKWVDLELILHLLHYICSTTSEGAVLIFLPGYDEIVTLRYNILYDDTRFSTRPESFQIFTLHSDMQTLDQRKVLDSSPPGVRKIILSTNIAETSITINDVVFVIDSGKVKEKSFDTLSHVSLLKTVWISKASVLQRKGRAGRCRPGICFHLFSRLRFNNMLEFQVPQLLRMPLQGLCLQTKLLAPSSHSVADFLSRAPQPPPADAISNAVCRLKTIDAMDQDEELTYLGCYLADLSLEPHLGKMLLCAVVLKCLDPILTIVCTLAYRDPFILPAQGSKKRDALQCRKRFSSYSLSDHMALLRVFQAWQKACYDGSERSFCQKNFVSQSTMEMILGMRVQLLGQLRAIGFVRPRGGSDIRELNLNSENWAVVKAALLAGMYPNMVHVNQDTMQLSSDKESKVHFHPTSVLNQRRETSLADSSSSLPTNWLIYDEMCRGKRMATVRGCSMVTPITVAVFGGSAMLPNSALQESAAQRPGDSQQNDSDSGMEDIAEIRVDKWLAFQLETEAAKNVNKLKQMWQNLFIKKIRFPAKSYTEREDTILQTLVLVLTEEEKAAGLQQPSGIGQRPRPMIPGDWPRAPVTKSKSSSPQQPTDFSHDKMPQTKVHSRAEASLSKGQLSDDLWTSCSLSSNGPSISTCPLTPGKPTSASQPVRYFIMESSNIKNLEISQQDGMWSTTLSIKTSLSRAFLENKLVILIFTVQGTGCFQGYARMTSEISRESCLDWGFVGLEEVFGVEWIHKQILPFQCAKHIRNPWNDNKVVYESSEGQELEPQTGRQLLLLWDRFFGTVDEEQPSAVRGPQYK